MPDDTQVILFCSEVESDLLEWAVPFSAVADNGSAIYWNASGIAQITDIEVQFMHAFLF